MYLGLLNIISSHSNIYIFNNRHTAYRYYKFFHKTSIEGENILLNLCLEKKTIER
jgi:hypothetical protein